MPYLLITPLIIAKSSHRYLIVFYHLWAPSHQVLFRAHSQNLPTRLINPSHGADRGDEEQMG